MNTTNPDPAGRQGAHVPRRRALSKPPHPDSALIDRLGGTQAAAAFFEVKGGSVSVWRYKGLPRARMMYLRVVRPDLFEPAEQQAAAPTSVTTQAAAA